MNKLDRFTSVNNFAIFENEKFLNIYFMSIIKVIVNLYSTALFKENSMKSKLISSVNIASKTIKKTLKIIKENTCPKRRKRM